MISTHALAQRLIAASERVPHEVLYAARLHFMDAIGVGTAAAQAGPVGGVVELAQRSGGPCAVLGSEESSSAAIAALINGTLMHSLEYDDTHTESVVHGSSVLAATALAVAQEVDAEGDTMLRAFAVAWEFFIRIGLASPGGLQARGFQVTSAGGVFAAAALAGLLRGNSVETLASAIGIAGSQAGGTFAFLANGDTVKAAQAGWAAHAGVLASELAMSGVTGPAAVFDGDYGFYRLYAQDLEAAARLAEHASTLGSTWHLPQAAFKLLPCCHYLHPFIEALEQVLADGVHASDVARVHSMVPVESVPIIAEPWAERQQPQKAQDARWSLPYVLGLVLQYGSVQARNFVGDIDNAVLKHATTMSYEPWTDSGFPGRFPARIQVWLHDGTSVSCEIVDVRGGASRPLNQQVVVEKFRNNLEVGGLTTPQVDAVLGALDRTSPDLKTLTSAIRPQAKVWRQ